MICFVGALSKISCLFHRCQKTLTNLGQAYIQHRRCWKIYGIGYRTSSILFVFLERRWTHCYFRFPMNNKIFFFYFSFNSSFKLGCLFMYTLYYFNKLKLNLLLGPCDFKVRKSLFEYYLIHICLYRIMISIFVRIVN